MKKKKPEGIAWEEFVETWRTSDHSGKLQLAKKYEVSYETAKHFISEAGEAQQKEPRPPFITYARENQPLVLKTGSGIKTGAVIGDFHNPYQDTKVVELVDRFLAEIQPDYLFYNGDVNDFYQVSVFSKDPARLDKLQKDLDITTDMFARHTELMPNTKKILVEGTHENRWFKYLQDKAPALSKLRSTNVTELYMLKKYDIEYVPFEQGVLVNGTFLIIHGDIASKHSAYTAKAHYENHGGSGICNHTHRLGSYYKRNRFGEFGWWENGCLCRLDPDWLSNPDWQQGFSLVHFKDDGRFFVEQIPIVEKKFIWGGRLYE